MDEKQPVLAIWVSPGMRAQLDAVAKARDASVGEIVRTAVLGYLADVSG